MGHRLLGGPISNHHSSSYREFYQVNKNNNIPYVVCTPIVDGQQGREFLTAACGQCCESGLYVAILQRHSVWIFIKVIACCIVIVIAHLYTLEIKMVNHKVDIPSVYTKISIKFQIYAGEED